MLDSLLITIITQYYFSINSWTWFLLSLALTNGHRSRLWMSPELAACTHQGGSETEVHLAPLRNLVADAFVCQELDQSV